MGSDLPWRQLTSLVPRRKRVFIAFEQGIRLFPIPGTPTTVTSCQVRARARVRSNASRELIAAQRSLPMSGVSRRRGAVARAGVLVCARYRPPRPRSGCDFPLARTGSLPRGTRSRHASRGTWASPTRIPPRWARAPWRREAVLTTSPVTIPSPVCGFGASSVDERLRRCGPRSGARTRSRSASRIASAARTARSASSSCATGAPKRGHDRVADELLDGAAESLDLPCVRVRSTGAEAPARLVLRIELLRLARWSRSGRRRGSSPASAPRAVRARRTAVPQAGQKRAALGQAPSRTGGTRPCCEDRACARRRA